MVSLTIPARWGAILLTAPGTDLVPPSAPTHLSASAGDGSVGLSWDPVPNAAGYFVYRSLVSGGGYTRLNSVPVTGAATIDDTVANGRWYYYVVTAVDDAGNESARSNEAAALPALGIGWANLQWPEIITHTISASPPPRTSTGRCGSTATPTCPARLKG
jgi:hypothetical protein